ncbi:MAG: LPS assembly protein LptD [Alcanivorax jadensis]|uniref:LPS-assembly protein LptD n=1 Tax=Alcanivorax jadensis TaxID=64988 RepID=UPI0030013236
MPLPVQRILIPGLLLLAGTSTADNDLNWVDREEMATFPAVQQRSIPEWCGGIYYNPAVGIPVAGSDTVVTADHSTMSQNGLIELDGDVLIEQPGSRITTDSAQLDQATGKFQLENGMRLESDQATFIASSMSGQTRRKEGSLLGVRYSLFNTAARGSADYIFLNETTTTITRGTYTTCAPGSNGWSLEGERIYLDREKGWGEANNVVLKVKSMPIFWLPWMTFPIDDRRKTGLLFPTIAIGDSSGGLDITQPIYVNIHPQLDATIGPRFIDGRGEGVDSEFRYLTPWGEGDISYGVLFNDRKFDDEDRQVARWTHNGNINRWNLKTDFNYVSDDFYFKDLDTGLEISSQTHLPRLAEARYYGRTWQVLGRMQSWQTIDPTLADQDLPYRRLPQLQLTGDPTLYGPLKGLWLSDITSFERSGSDDSGKATGLRAHAAPALNLRLQQPWGYLEPRARLYHTRYELDSVDANAEDNPDITTWGASVDSGLFFERPSRWFGEDFTQTLEPRLFVNKVAFKNQAFLPNFDSRELTFSYNSLFRENRFIGYDRIGDEEKLALGLTSRFLHDATGREQLRLRLAQGFYFDDRKVVTEQTVEDPTDDQTPLVGDARWNFARDWYLYTEAQWDLEENERERSSFQIGYNDRERRVVNVGYHDRPEDDIRESELSGILPIHRHWRMVGRWMYDLENKRTLETIAGAEYRNCCWKLRLLSQRELVDDDGDGDLEADSTIWIQIQMVGLGGFGGQVDALLERSIPGYRRQYD